ncbi:MAG TPA: efflux RND transporter periplasmic adaptor subunit [Terriglobales bacterium]|nr:efflux RND transporter periplasmic adaptor subunit [Terriglobales bacterium]
MQHQVQSDKQIIEPPSRLRDAAQRTHPRRRWLISVLSVLIVATLLIYGIWTRVRAKADLADETNQTAVIAVSVVQPQRTAPTQEIILPGNVEPFVSAPIYSRTNGYLQKWYVDIGDHVKQGQLLAVIETPEVDQQLQQSRSNLATAQANLKLAEITANRYQGLLNSHAVAQQDVDTATQSFHANQAIVEADQANVRQLETLQSFEKIYAPFDGIITARNTDIGNLIDSGSSGGVKTDLFHIAQPGKLRVYVDVPESYAPSVKTGLIADLSLAEFPGRTFQGKVVRTADAINVTTRTLQVEIDVNNPSGTLLTGSYAEVKLKLPEVNFTYLLPVETLIFRSQDLLVAVVKDGKVELTRITPGRDLGEKIEVIAGLSPGNQVILNPPDSMVSGQAVQIVPATLPGDGK